MATNPDEYVIIKYVVDANEAIQNAQRMREIINQSKIDIKNLADQAKVSLKDAGKALVESFKSLKFGDEKSITKLKDFLNIDSDTIRSSSTFARARLEAINLIRTATTELGQEERRQATESAKVITSAKQQEGVAQREYEQSTKRGYDQVMSPAAKAYGEQVQAVKQQIVSQAGATGQTYLQVAQQMQQAGTSAKVLNSALKELQPTAQKTTSAFSNLGQTIQQALVIALGINLYNIIQQIATLMKEAAVSAYELSKAFFQLDIGIRAVRRAGVDITTPEMLENLDRLSEKFGVFSKKSLVEGSAALVNLIRDMGMTKEQIFELQDAIATLAIVNGRSMDEVQKTVALALSSGYTEGLQRLGVSINRVNIAARANAMGWEGGYTALTEHQRALATLSLIMEKTGKYADDLTQYLKTEVGQIDATTAAIEDQKAALGEELIPVTLEARKAQLEFYKVMTDFIEQVSPLIRLLVTISESIQRLRDTFTSLKEAQNPLGGIIRFLSEMQKGVSMVLHPWELFQGAIKNITNGMQTLKDTQQGFWDPTFMKNLGWVTDTIEKLFGMKSKTIELPAPEVGTPDMGMDEAETTAKDTADYVRELHNDMEAEQRRFNNRMAELERDLARDLAKIDRELARDLADLARERDQDLLDIAEDGKQKIADAEEAYARKVANANQDYNNKVAEANRKYQEQAIEAETRFQEEMRKLREEFVFDLEGALQERDAKQVLNLIRRYNLDKEQAKRDFDLDQQERARQHQLEMEQLAREREERLQALAEEQALKIAQIKEETALRLQERQIQYEREVEDRNRKAEEDRAERAIKQDELIEELKIDAKERIDEIAAKLSEEKDMTAEKLAEIAAEYEKIYGLNGVLDMYMQNYISILAARAGQIIGVISRMMQTYSMLSSFYKGIGGNSGGGGMQKPPTMMAAGGSLYADRPTTVVFGEAGPEIAEFTPVSKLGKKENKVSTGNGTPASVANGRVAVRIDLAPDLIGRIEENTLNQAAEILLESQRRVR